MSLYNLNHPCLVLKRSYVLMFKKCIDLKQTVLNICTSTFLHIGCTTLSMTDLADKGQTLSREAILLRIYFSVTSFY